MAKKMIENKLALITGGANGIGKATAELFMKHGAKVIILDIDSEAGNRLLPVWDEQGLNATFYHIDITDYNAVSSLATELISSHGRVDILVNNAGITRDSSLKKMTPEQWKQVIDVNLTGVFNMTRVFGPHMMEQGNGRILNASSVVGIYGNFGQTNYVASKSGVIGMTKTWAREFGKYGVTVNAVAPGFIQTEMLDNVPEEVLEKMRSQAALKRLGTVEDVANAYLFLASESAAFITGATLSVDGGLVIQ